MLCKDSGGSIAALTTSMVRAGHVFDFMELRHGRTDNIGSLQENGLERKELKGDK